MKQYEGHSYNCIREIEGKCVDSGFHKMSLGKRYQIICVEVDHLLNFTFILNEVSSGILFRVSPDQASHAFMVKFENETIDKNKATKFRVIMNFNHGTVATERAEFKNVNDAKIWVKSKGVRGAIYGLIQSDWVRIFDYSADRGFIRQRTNGYYAGSGKYVRF